MSTTYKTQVGDDFESIARRQYGDESQANLIRRANPGTVEPLTEGITLFIPPLIPAKPARLTAENGQGITIRIGSTVFNFWTQVSLSRAADTFDMLEMSAPFDPDNKDQRELFRPFSFQPVQVHVGAEMVFNGTLVGVVPSSGTDGRTVELSAYSLPGVLNDAMPPASDLENLEFNNLTLDKIAKKVAEPFGIGVVFKGPAGAAFEQVAVTPTQTILDFLAGLAKQRKLIISNTPSGELLFYKPDTSKPARASFVEGESPLLSVEPFFTPQAYYSHITGLELVVVGSYGSQLTVKNPRLTGVLRPLNFEAKDVSGGELKTAVEAKVGRMFGNMVAYNLGVATWRDIDGLLWMPGEVVMLYAPGAMVYNPTRLMIRSIKFKRDDKQESVEIDTTLPESFTDKTPETFPWD